MILRSDKFLKKHRILPSDIKYVIRENDDTVLYLNEGEVISTYLPFKEIEKSLPDNMFIYPNKGVLIAISQIANVQNKVCETKDGKIFNYRKNNSGSHDRRLLMVDQMWEQKHSPSDTNKYLIFDEIPLPVFALKMDFNKEKIQASFTFCYCNQAMCDYVDYSYEDIIDHPIQEIFSHLDMKWYSDLADVALNNTVKMIKDFSNDTEIDVLCFQPCKGYCL